MHFTTRGTCLLIARMSGVSRVALTGFEGLDRSRKKRIEALILRLVGLVNGKGWALGLFDVGGNLVDYDVSCSGIGGRLALTLLCKLPFPLTQGPVTVQAGEPSAGNALSVIGAATPTGTGRSLGWIVQASAPPEPVSGELADELQRLTHQIALVIADAPNSDDDRRRSVVPNGFHGFYLLDPQFNVERAWHTREPLSCDFADLIEPRDRRLPIVVERAVRRLTASWNFLSAGACATGVAYPLPDLMLKVVPMAAGGPEVSIGVFAEQCTATHGIERAAATFRISRREREVLHALLDGNSIAEIASVLNLAESTVNDHIARMIVKTNARNRIEMAAMLLGWPEIQKRNASPSDKGRPAASRVRCAWRYTIAKTTMGNEPVS
jgi:DNA-binding CsgD family transcriptional regulator